MRDSQRDILIEYLLQSDQAVRSLNIYTDYKRCIWDSVNQYIQRFFSDQTNQWIIIPGLRGIGKTTLLAQLYNHQSLMKEKVSRFYFSLEQLSLTNTSVNDLVEAFKFLRREHPEQIFFIFLDEVHSDPQWSLGCKIIFDQIPNSFLVCTGSSALSLRLNPDSARRAHLIKMYPLSLTEFIAIRQIKSGVSQASAPESSLSSKLRNALFESRTVIEAYEGLENCRELVSQYYSDVEQTGFLGSRIVNEYISLRLIEEYINGYGTLPFFSIPKQVNMQMGLLPPGVNILHAEYDKREIREMILQTVEQTLIGDTLKLLAGQTNDSRVNFQLQASTINLLPKLIRILANSERTSLRTIATKLENTHQKTLGMMLKVLIMSDLISEIPPLGSYLSRSTKTPKYLFGAPALRQALVPINLSKEVSAVDYQSGQLRGRLLEDTIVMYLERIFGKLSEKRSIEHDSRARGADFVITPEIASRSQIVIEVGYGKKTAVQAKQTLQDTGGLFGLVITSSIIEPTIDTNNNSVYVPLSYFLLT